MAIPRVEIQPGDNLQKAEERVDQAFERERLDLVAFANLNTQLPCSDTCHFFHCEFDGAPYVIVVTAGAWTEDMVITVLNVLLELRTDSDPPGSRLFVRFYSAEPVPGVLGTLFGDSAAADLECRAALIARFGHDFEPTDCQRLGAAASFLLRSLLDVDIPLSAEDGERRITEVVCEHLGGIGLPSEPVNSLIILGCLYGEVLRCRIGGSSRWLRVPEFDPWPGLHFSLPSSAPQRYAAGGADDGTEGDSDVTEGSVDVAVTAEGDAAAGLAFNPIAHVIHVWTSRQTDALQQASDELLGRLS